MYASDASSTNTATSGNDGPDNVSVRPRLPSQMAEFRPDVRAVQPALSPQIHPRHARLVRERGPECALVSGLRVRARVNFGVVRVRCFGVREKRFGVVFHEPELAM